MGNNCHDYFLATLRLIVVVNDCKTFVTESFTAQSLSPQYRSMELVKDDTILSSLIVKIPGALLPFLQVSHLSTY